MVGGTLWNSEAGVDFGKGSFLLAGKKLQDIKGPDYCRNLVVFCH
jgi:hypothetical protein